MPSCIIMRGPSGIGKSTWIQENHPDAIICSADHYFLTEEGEYEFDPRHLAEAHSECLAKFVSAITNREPVVIVDNTNTTKWEYINYQHVAMAFGYVVTLHEFTVGTIDGLKELIRRQKTGKQVPTEILCQMVLNFVPGMAHRVLYSTIEEQMLSNHA